MIIESVTVGHFRCIEECEVLLGPYVAIVGANGVGKSTVLEAIRFVLDPSYRPTPADVNICRPGEPLSVTMRFINLTVDERVTWSANLGGDDVLELRKMATTDGGGSFEMSFHGSVRRHENFEPLWAAMEGNKTNFRGIYGTFRTANPDYGLLTVTRWEDARDQIVGWEAAHPDLCVVKNVTLDAKATQAELGDAFRIVYVPAVSRAEEALVGRQSGLAELINQMLWPTVLARPEIVALQESTRAAYREIFPVEGSTELDEAQNLINKSLALFAPGTALKLGWNPDSVPSIKPPDYRTVVVEDGVSNDVALKGHGVQRALVVSVLNALNEDNNSKHPVEGGVNRAPTTILLVEEPELYQHPTRARHFASALDQLASIADDKPRMQVILTTHSPYFVSVSKFDAIRLVRRDRRDARPSPARRVSMARLEDVAAGLRAARGYAAGSNDEKVMLARLGTLMDTEIREGFFADLVVLAEGASDVAAITAALADRGVDADASGIAIIDAGGKANLDKLWLIFSQIELPVFMMFDGDLGKTQSAVDNPRLLTLVGASPIANPETTVAGRYAVFEYDLETTLASEFGPEYERLMEAECASHGYGRNQGEKVSAVVTSVYHQLHAAGLHSPTLNAICDSIVALTA